MRTRTIRDKSSRWYLYPRPTVERCPCNCGLWRAEVTVGYSGNYETWAHMSDTWRKAFDWAYNEVRNWRK
jgi:hypothetical protein